VGDTTSLKEALERQTELEEVSLSFDKIGNHANPVLLAEAITKLPKLKNVFLDLSGGFMVPEHSLGMLWTVLNIHTLPEIKLKHMFWAMNMNDAFVQVMQAAPPSGPRRMSIHSPFLKPVDLGKILENNQSFEYVHADLQQQLALKRIPN
jgi:hypothetical protein